MTGSRVAVLLALLLSLAVPGVAGADPWTPLLGSAPAQRGGEPQVVAPDAGSYWALDRPELRDALAAGRTVALPAPDGTLQRFSVTPSPVAAARLSDTAGFDAYAGVGIDDPTATIRFDVSVLGYHASVRSASGAWYVDPAYRYGAERHVAYYGRDLVTERTPLTPDGDDDTVARSSIVSGRATVGTGLRRYRLALASDRAYRLFFSPAADSDATANANVNAAKLALMNRVNEIYASELDVFMTLVADNAKLNFNDVTSSTAAWGAKPTCTDTVLNASQLQADTKIGDANYDIGHVVLGTNGGGLAGLGVVSQTGVKATGCTGVPTPAGDGFAVDYVAHEMGHQFGANHTFNGIDGNCSGRNRNQATSVEPGSGSSIMGYAGICDTDDLQPHSDPYFSFKSFDEIQAYIAATGTPNSTVSTGNAPPVVDAGPDHAIPPRTPFTLTPASTTDPNGDPLVFTWEQTDAGASTGTALFNPTKTRGPLFRMFSFAANETNTESSPATGANAAMASDRTRTFPDVAQIAADNTDAVTSTGADRNCPAKNVDCFSEYLPITDRTLTFRLTARDGRTGGGGVASDDTAVTVAGSDAFRVTAPVARSVDASAPITITWRVGQTTVAPVSTSAVRISFSTDGGLTFPTEILAPTPNDGSEAVIVPDVVTSTGRFKVEAVDNIFFDVSHGNLNVTPPGTTPPDPTVVTTTTPPTGTPPSSTATTTPPDSTGGGGTATPTPPTNGATPGADGGPTATVTPTVPFVADLNGVRTNPRRKGRTLRPTVSCGLVSDGVPATPDCVVAVTLRAKVGGRPRLIAASTVALPAGAPAPVTLRLSRAAVRRIGRGTLRATLAATVDTQTVRKRVKLR